MDSKLGGETEPIPVRIEDGQHVAFGRRDDPIAFSTTGPVSLISMIKGILYMLLSLGSPQNDGTYTANETDGGYIGSILKGIIFRVKEVAGLLRGLDESRRATVLCFAPDGAGGDYQAGQMIGDLASFMGVIGSARAALLRSVTVAVQATGTVPLDLYLFRAPPDGTYTSGQPPAWGQGAGAALAGVVHVQASEYVLSDGLATATVAPGLLADTAQGELWCLVVARGNVSLEPEALTLSLGFERK